MVLVGEGVERNQLVVKREDEGCLASVVSVVSGEKVVQWADSPVFRLAD